MDLAPSLRRPWVPKPADLIREEREGGERAREGEGGREVAERGGYTQRERQRERQVVRARGERERERERERRSRRREEEWTGAEQPKGHTEKET
jgi:hypothetical protein